MSKRDMEEQIIQSYQRDEGMMILIFAQWCVNNGLEATELYHRAYPQQGPNHMLRQMLDNTVPKEESEEIPDQTLMQVLSLFGNDDLAFVVQQEIDKRPRNKQ